ncbi:MAG: CDP-alcohol phosphatidyltransferase family protein [Bacteroidales bacterium]|nr:CDP-alcohol phosphatidyltransferase family protein [Bacteroidales bacterium]
METKEIKQSKRIQTSVLNAAERKALMWLASKQPAWMTSNILTFIGIAGSVIIALGYILSDKNIAWLWLASAGFVINWYGDSLDGSLARYRNAQRPVYGFYLDHMVDVFNEMLMFIGVGLSALMDLRIGLFLFAAYLMMTVNVSVNAHLKSEFKLTYARVGPTEFRIIVIIVNTLLILIRPLREFSLQVALGSDTFLLTALDLVGLVISAVLFIMFMASFFGDLRYYAKIDPPKK